MTCFDCPTLYPAYMVRDNVWLQAWPEYPKLRGAGRWRCGMGMTPRRRFLGLCFTCLERRLGRPLAPVDFNLDLVINAGVKLGLRMRSSQAAVEGY